METPSTGAGCPVRVAAVAPSANGHGDDRQRERQVEWRVGAPILGERAAVADVPERAPWMLLSNHGLTLLVIAADPSCRISEMAAALGITERATIRMVNDLVRAGYVVRTRIGRRNAYAVNRDARLRHPAFRWQSISALLRLLDESGTGGAGTEAGDGVIALRPPATPAEVVAASC